MRIPIQEAVPYESSLIWQQHQDHYQELGLEVFLNQDVPYNISSNPSYAAQAAKLFLSALPSILPESLPILEVGAGSGIFAVNFLRALTSLAPEAAKRVCYWLTDFSTATILSLSQQAVFQTFIAAGQIKLYIMNGNSPQDVECLAGETMSLADIGFQLVVANYYFSVLPTAVLHRQDQKWFKQYLALEWMPCGEDPEPEAVQVFLEQVSQALMAYRLSEHLAADHPQWHLFQALEKAQTRVSQKLLELSAEADFDFKDWLVSELLAHWAEALETEPTEQMQQTIIKLLVLPLLGQDTYDLDALAQESSFRQLPLSEIVTRDLECQAIETITQDYAIATVGYSEVGVASLKALIKLICPNGLMLISDKAYSDRSWMQGMHPEPVARHGSTLSHPVNFPLFEEVLKLKGISSHRTDARSNALHSLLIYCGPEMPAPISNCFEQHFIDYPGHEISHALLEGGHALLRQNQMEQALRSFEKALTYRPGDGTLQYLTALCYLEHQRYSDAIALLTQEHDDLYALLNRAILLAEAYRLIGQYEPAIEAYQQALNYGHDSLTLYHLAQCQNELGDTASALKNLSEAHELNPDDEEIQLALSEIES